MRAGVGFRQALTVALAADTVCIAVMELLDNAVVLTFPGAMNAGLTSLLFQPAPPRIGVASSASEPTTEPAL
jgi:hypothetical protein